MCLGDTLKVKAIVSSKAVKRCQGRCVDSVFKMMIGVAICVKKEKQQNIGFLLITVIFKWTIWPLAEAVRCHFEEVLENCGLGDSNGPDCEKCDTFTLTNYQILIECLLTARHC